MPKTTSSLYHEDAPVLRFEDSDDFHSLPVQAANYASAPQQNAAFITDPYSELQQKQEALLKMRQDLEKTQREADELETRKRKEERFTNGRREITEKLARTQARLEREMYKAQKAIEEISVARESFSRHLDSLREIQPEIWKRSELDEHLDRAIGVVEDAEEEFSKSSLRLATVMTEPGSANSASAFNLANLGLSGNFMACFRLGLAFSLPLIIATLAFILVLKLLP